MQSFDTKDLNTLESFDRKFESFNTKDSEVEQADNEYVESFDRKFESYDTSDTKDLEVKQSDSDCVESFERKFESFESKDTKIDGRSKPRTRKQIDAYKQNFGAGKVIERKIYELDKRVQHLQNIILGMKRCTHGS